MILVTGATGNFGGSTAHELQQKGIPFRAAARHMETLQKRFGHEAAVAAFDWDRPDTFPALLEEIQAVFLMPPPLVSNDFHNRARPFVDVAKKAGVKHLVLATALYSDHRDSLFYGTEALVKGSGLDFTIIRPSFVFQNFLNQFLPSVREGLIMAPSENGKTSYVDIRNVGEAAAVVLENPSAHAGRTYAITGSEALTHSQIAAIFSRRLSRPVVHISPSAEEYKKTLARLNVPEALHGFLAALYATIAKGQWEEASGDYTLLTGKRPNTFEAFVEEHRSIFAGAGS